MNETKTTARTNKRAPRGKVTTEPKTNERVHSPITSVHLDVLVELEVEPFTDEESRDRVLHQVAISDDVSYALDLLQDALVYAVGLAGVTRVVENENPGCTHAATFHGK